MSEKVRPPLFGTSFVSADQVKSHLASISACINDPQNAAEYLSSKIGLELTDLFFRPYTKKMWSLDLEDLAVSVVRRIPLRMDRTDNYFSADEVQMVPRLGYTALFENILSHPNISLTLNAEFKHSMLKQYYHCFNSMAIDEFFDYRFGELPYRSIRFHHRTISTADRTEWSVINFTDATKFTRETRWHVFPGHIERRTARYTCTKEEPCDYRDNRFERYYPLLTSDGRYQQLYRAYKEMARAERRVTFIGRCGTYQYLDMDQVINQSSIQVQRWLRGQIDTS